MIANGTLFATSNDELLQGGATRKRNFVMLVLSRKIGESIVVPGCDLTITVVRLSGNRVRLGISAPIEVAVHREEVLRRFEDPSKPAEILSGREQRHRSPR